MGDPATFGVPGPGRAVVMANNSLRPANTPAPAAGHIASVRPTNIITLALERQATAANASGIVNIDQIMSTAVNNRNPFKRTFRESARIVGQSDLSIQSQSHIEPHSQERSSSARTDSATSTEALAE